MPRVNDVPAPDFTLKGYERLLLETKSRYPIAGFEVLDVPDIASSCGGSFCIVRHDIDMSPDLALEIAQIEKAAGVRATYAVLLTGAFYNPLERHTRAKLMKIAQLGHDIALHFDAAWHEIACEKDLDDAIRRELATLQTVLPGISIRTFAFHNTTEFSLSCQARSYGGLRNAYAGDLARDVAYVSDSNGHWRFKSWQATLDESHPRLQVLTHPEWWTAEAISPAERVCQHLASQARRVWNEYCDHLRINGRENQSDVPIAMEILAGGTPDERDILQLWLTGHRLEAVRRLGYLRQGAHQANDSRHSVFQTDADKLAIEFQHLAKTRPSRTDR